MLARRRAVRHELYEDCVHVFQAFLFLDASRKALQSARHFVRTALDKRGRSQVSDKARHEIDREMRNNMGDVKGKRVEPRTGETEGSVKSQSDEEHDSDRDDEQWELDQKAEDAKEGAAAGSAAHGAFKVAEKVLGVDDKDVTRATNAGAAEARSDSLPSRKSRTQPSSPAVTSHRPFFSHMESGSSTSSSSASGQRRPAPPSMSLEEARASASAGMRAHHSSHSRGSGSSFDVGKFQEGRPVAAPRLRERSQSNMAIDELVKSFETKPAIKTARWTAE